MNDNEHIQYTIQENSIENLKLKEIGLFFEAILRWMREKFY